MSFFDSNQSTFGFGNDNVGTATNNPYNNNLNFDPAGQAPIPQWQQNAMTPIQNGDPYLNQGMQQAGGNIAVSDNFGGFEKSNSSLMDKVGGLFGDAIEIASKYTADDVPKASASAGSFSGGGGSFRPVEAPVSNLSYLNKYTSPFTNGWKR